MAYLELSPMIVALRERPADFEVDRGWLTHFPSRHSFKFDRQGNVTLSARCGCTALSIRTEDAQQLWSEYKAWRDGYWRPIEINREFASHFRRPNILQRILRRALAKMRRLVLDPALDEERVAASSNQSATANA